MQSSSHILANRRILITRAQVPEESCVVTELLSGLGAEVLSCPLTEIRFTPFCLPALSRHDWLFFTSANAVRGFFRHPDLQTGQHQILPKIGVIGTGTEKALKTYGFIPDFIPPEFSAHKAADALVSLYNTPQHLLWPHGNLASPVFQQTLETSGLFTVTGLEVYRTEPLSRLEQRHLETIHGAPIDVITFSSTSAVVAFFNFGLDKTLFFSPSGVRPWIACIGPNTAEALTDFALPPDILPPAATFASMGEAISSFLQNHPLTD